MDKKKVLVIDDEEDFGAMIKLYLERTGNYEVRIETEGVRGFAVTKEFCPDVILLDIILPDLPGEEIVSQIKADNDIKDTPIIFVTAVLKGTDAEKDYPVLFKPIRINDLIDCIEKNTK
ncbi:MAG: response regulator [Candidatus Omnitrophota bacterium]